MKRLTVTIAQIEDGTVFFYGTSSEGEDFTGTASDINTAMSMAWECLYPQKEAR